MAMLHVRLAPLRGQLTTCMCAKIHTKKKTTIEHTSEQQTWQDATPVPTQSLTTKSRSLTSTINQTHRKSFPQGPIIPPKIAPSSLKTMMKSVACALFPALQPQDALIKMQTSSKQRKASALSRRGHRHRTKKSHKNNKQKRKQSHTFTHLAGVRAEVQQPLSNTLQDPTKSNLILARMVGIKHVQKPTKIRMCHQSNKMTHWTHQCISTYTNREILPYGISRYKILASFPHMTHLVAYLFLHTARLPG